MFISRKSVIAVMVITLFLHISEKFLFLMPILTEKFLFLRAEMEEKVLKTLLIY